MSDGSPILFVCGHRKSGTTMFVDLFDGHPELAVLPHDIKVLYAYHPRFTREPRDDESRRRRLERLLFVDLEHQLERRDLKGVFDVEGYRQRFWEALAGRPPDDIVTLVKAVAAALDATASKRWVVLKETSIEAFAPELLGQMPAARMIQLVRDPRDNFAALASGVESYYSRLGQGRAETLMSLLFRTQMGFRAAARGPQAFPGRYRVVRFEDLVARPEETMKDLSSWLGVEFSPAMLVPTFFGRSTTGNSFERLDMSKISARNVGRWAERVDAREVAVIEHHLEDAMGTFGYEPTVPEASRAAAYAEFYAWANSRYFFADPYDTDAPLGKHS